ncbi:MAG: type I-E CRISPR-associated protein Cse2/CasB [Candidatus Binataceae bacterium]
MNGTHQSYVALVKHLESLYGLEDRAELAILRRSLGKPPGASPEVFRIIGRFLPESVRAEEDCFLVAALFAKHPLSWPPSGEETRRARNFGASMHKLKLKREGRSEGVERRFSALLAASREELGDHLRHAISLLAADEVAVDWLQLLDDLGWWHLDERPVQRRWARAFWRSPENPEDVQMEENPAESQEGDE